MRILERQDITALPFRVDCIVNSAHPSLMPGGGVCGSIHRSAGTAMAKSCAALLVSMGVNELWTPRAAVTPAFDLNAEWCVHAVAPVYGDFNNSTTLRKAYGNALFAAKKIGARSVAFPLLGAGIYGWPHDKALAVATDALKDEKEIQVCLCLYP